MNGEEFILSFLEPSSTDYQLETLVREHSPDCYTVVYAVDDAESLSNSFWWIFKILIFYSS